MQPLSQLFPNGKPGGGTTTPGTNISASQYSLEELRAALYGELPHLALLGEITPADPSMLGDLANAGGRLPSEPFTSPVKDFYLTNPIARASRVMAECSALRAGRRLEAAGRPKRKRTPSRAS